MVFFCFSEILLLLLNFSILGTHSIVVYMFESFFQSRLYRILRNKYVLTLLVAGLWMLFMDKYSMVAQWNMRKNLKELEKDKAYYFQGITETDYKIEQMKTDLQETEKYARENYWLKKPNEDIFIIVEE